MVVLTFPPAHTQAGLRSVYLCCLFTKVACSMEIGYLPAAALGGVGD
jgi:hypothetical protein